MGVSMVRFTVPVKHFGMEICMSTIGVRIKQERERLGMTIPEFAEAAGSKKNTVIDWQKDASSPPAAKLAALAEVGVDVLYVVTGIKSASLMGEEELLLSGFRKMNAEMKQRTLAMVYGGTPPEPNIRMNVQGDVGNQIGTNSGAISVNMRGKKR